jgi:hypothetical protein
LKPKAVENEVLAAMIVSWSSRSNRGAGEDVTTAKVRLWATSSALGFEAGMASFRKPEARGAKAKSRVIAKVRKARVLASQFRFLS